MNKNPDRTGTKGTSRRTKGRGADRDSPKGRRSAPKKGPPPSRSRGMRAHAKVTSSGPRKPARTAPRKGRRDQEARKSQWIWGAHAVTAVLSNPKRTVHELLLSPSAAERLGSIASDHAPRITEPREMDNLLPQASVHQGMAVRAAPLQWPELETLAENSDLLLILDQITDPHNVGAMLRLASAFGVGAIIMQDRNAPPLTGATAKVAVGCVETVPVIHVTNIADTLQLLKTHHYQVTGLAGETNLSLQDALHPNTKQAIVMGAEGPGLRTRVAKTCDRLARIPMTSNGEAGTAESLNVATAAAIALYEARRETPRAD